MEIKASLGNDHILEEFGKLVAVERKEGYVHISMNNSGIALSATVAEIEFDQPGAGYFFISQLMRLADSYGNCINKRLLWQQPKKDKKKRSN